MISVLWNSYSPLDNIEPYGTSLSDLSAAIRSKESVDRGILPSIFLGFVMDLQKY